MARGDRAITPRARRRRTFPAAGTCISGEWVFAPDRSIGATISRRLARQDRGRAARGQPATRRCARPDRFGRSPRPGWCREPEVTATIAVRRRDGGRGRRWKRTGSAPPPAALPPERAGFRHRRPGGLAGLAPSARSSGSENLLSQMDRARDRGSRRARCARGYQCGRGIRGWGGCQLRTAMRVLHALGHALVISGSLTWRSSGHTDPRLRPAVVCRPGCAGHRHLAARRRPAQGGTAASCWETTPHRHSRSRTSACCCSPARSTPCGRSGHGGWLLRSPVR